MRVTFVCMHGGARPAPAPQALGRSGRASEPSAVLVRRKLVHRNSACLRAQVVQRVRQREQGTLGAQASGARASIGSCLRLSCLDHPGAMSYRLI